MTRTTGHFALYGTTTLPRKFCLECNTYAFVISNEFRCCGSTTGKPATQKTIRMIEATAGRKKPGKAVREKILKMQNHCCRYCDRAFGTYVIRKGKRVTLRLHWDHAVPYIYSYNNKASNFVAACHVCNGMKGAYIFESFEKAIRYLRRRWKEKGYTNPNLQPLSSRLPADAPVAEVLRAEV